MAMIFLAIILLGFISYMRLPRELFPPITFPQLTVLTNYENAAPEEIEVLITKPIEDACSSVNNVKRIVSTSREGVSLVMLEFGWGTSMDFAALNVREKIDLVKEKLPRECEDPIVMKFNPFELPAMTLSVSADMPLYEVREVAKKIIKNQLEKAEGVAAVQITGGLDREILVDLDLGRLNAAKLSSLSVMEALKNSNVNYPAGTIHGHFYDYLIRTMGEFTTLDDIANSPIGLDKSAEYEAQEEQALNIAEVPITEPTDEEKRRVDNRVVLVSDIGEVKDTFKEKTSISRYNGRENISITIQKQAGSNTLEVVSNVKKALDKLKADLPKGRNIKIITVYDQSIFVRQSINGVFRDAFVGGVLAFLVILVFLRNLRSSIIVMTSIPISILATFSLMYFSNITLNMMSLGGLALGIGRLVDDSIVCIENIYRHCQLGLKPKEAAVVGASEVSTAVVASTLTTIVVFLPMVFVKGVAGQLFSHLALTVTFSLMASTVGAMLLIPMLVSQGSERQLNEIKFLRVVERFLNKLESFFMLTLDWFLKNRLVSMGLVLGLFLATMLLVIPIKKEFMPKVDQGQFVVKINLPTGALIDVTDRVAKQVEDILLAIPEIYNVTLNIGSSKDEDVGQAAEAMGSHQAQLMINLKKERDRSTGDVVQELKDKVDKLDTGPARFEYLVQDSALQISAFTGGAPVAVVVKGNDLNLMEKITKDVEELLLGVRGIYGVKNTIVEEAPETKVYIQRDKAALYNLSVDDIARTAKLAIKGTAETKFKEPGKDEVDIRVRMRQEDRENVTDLRNLFVHSPLEMQVPLNEVAYIGVGVGPSEIKRQDRQRYIMVTANIYKRSLNEVIAEIREKLNKYPVPEEYYVYIGGESEQMAESFQSLVFALVLAFLLVYMIMASQFESLIQPFIIMFTVPLSLIGVMILLFLSATPISIVVIIGMIMLIGIVVSNGIILIDYTNLLREQGVEAEDAIVRASRIRMRPILMTAFSTVIALCPLALAIGEGAELMSPLAVTVIGGLTSSTFLTIVVIPVIYLMVDEAKERLAMLFHRPAEEVS
ncbi:efflux RND transporter permease subunit [candidate division FCPU426 bacterium]|nr:efflux RND transporter permease subunit [candidate division FCPU426 bacterium]